MALWSLLVAPVGWGSGLSLFGHLLPFLLLAMVALGSSVCSAFIARDALPVASSIRHAPSLRIQSLTYVDRRFVPHSFVAPSLRSKRLLSVSADKTLFQDGPSPLPIEDNYACPPTSLEALRRRYGTRRSVWGEWGSMQTRQFYKQQLPKALQVDGALGLSLEERAKLASQARFVLRLYARERSHLPIRWLARIYDGARHMNDFGYWSSDGMNWPEVKLKYSREAAVRLGANATEDEINLYVHQRIIEKACTTNPFMDNLALQGDCRSIKTKIRESVWSHAGIVQTVAKKVTSSLQVLRESLLGRGSEAANAFAASSHSLTLPWSLLPPTL